MRDERNMSTFCRLLLRWRRILMSFAFTFFLNKSCFLETRWSSVRIFQLFIYSKLFEKTKMLFHNIYLQIYIFLYVWFFFLISFIFWYNFYYRDDYTSYVITINIYSTYRIFSFSFSFNNSKFPRRAITCSK